MKLPAVRRRTHLRLLLSLIPLLVAGCVAEAPTTAPMTPSAATPMPPSTPPNPPPEVPTATIVAESGPTPIMTTTLDLAPLQPLRDTTIVNRSPNALEALTDGQKKYKVAVWSPGGAWIAAVPQDGPGLDVVSAETGERRTIVTDTYVLEPTWLEQETLVVHQVANDADLLVQYTLDGRAVASRAVAQSQSPLGTVDAAGGMLSYVQGAQLNVQHLGRSDGAWTAPLKALVSAPAPNARDAPVVALSPWVEDLQQVRTLLVTWEAERLTTTFLSGAGEGLWLPQWAPDGTKLALTHIGGRVVTTSVDGRARYDLGPGDRPAWSPDSSRIAYAGTSAGKEFLSRDIYVVDWQGGSARIQLTGANEEQLYTSPSWSPDGSRIAVVEIDSGQIFVVAAPR